MDTKTRPIYAGYKKKKNKKQKKKKNKKNFIPKDTYRLKVKGWKSIFHANGKQKKTGAAILIS